MGERDAPWDEKYRKKAPADCPWYLPHPPEELVTLLQTIQIPPGPAVDLGCGAGVATSYLSGFFAPTVGIDIAQSALAEARALARERRATARFAVADVPQLPLRRESIAFVFDRGCLHALPSPRWPRYFREIDRILVSGGVFELFALSEKNLPRLLSVQGLRVRLGLLLHRRGRASRALLDRLRPRSLSAVTMEDLPVRLADGREVFLLHAVFRKT